MGIFSTPWCTWALSLSLPAARGGCARSAGSAGTVLAAAARHRGPDEAPPVSHPPAASLPPTLWPCSTTSGEETDVQTRNVCPYSPQPPGGPRRQHRLGVQPGEVSSADGARENRAWETVAHRLCFLSSGPSVSKSVWRQVKGGGDVAIIIPNLGFGLFCVIF